MKPNADNVRLFMDQEPQVSKLQSLFMNAWSFGGRRDVRTIILTLICHYSGMNGKVVFLVPSSFLLDQEVILLRQSLLMDSGSSISARWSLGWLRTGVTFHRDLPS